jgi:hypothetical protein
MIGDQAARLQVPPIAKGLLHAARIGVALTRAGGA